MWSELWLNYTVPRDTLLNLFNCVGCVGLDHVILVKVASTAVVSKLLCASIFVSNNNAD